MSDAKHYTADYNFLREDGVAIFEIRPVSKFPVQSLSMTERIADALNGAHLRTMRDRAAEALADEVAVLVRREVIDSRSPAADALLDFRDPPSSDRADRMAALEAEVAHLRPRSERLDRLDAADYAKLRAWVASPEREPPQTHFTAGWARDAARAIESGLATAHEADVARLTRERDEARAALVALAESDGKILKALREGGAAATEPSRMHLHDVRVRDEEIARLREALTPSTETKGAYSGEFHFDIPERDEDGNEQARRIDVPWQTVKEILAAVQARAGVAVHVRPLSQTTKQRIVEGVRRFHESAPDPTTVMHEHIRGDGALGPAPGDWPEDADHENGQYQRKCCECGREFIGHKRRVVCKVCASKDATSTETEA